MAGCLEKTHDKVYPIVFKDKLNVYKGHLKVDEVRAYRLINHVIKFNNFMLFTLNLGMLL